VIEKSMPRLFRATLPNGQKVCIRADLRRTASEVSELAAQAAHLASLVETDETSERVLLSFLANICPVVFPEADPAKPAQIVHGPAERTLDLTFALRGRSEIGAVEIRKPGNSGHTILSSLEQIRHLLGGSAFREPVKAVYVIAGRGLVSAMMVERASHLANETNLPIQLLSWDEVVNRLTIPPDEESETELTVVVVEVIDFSRRLLRWLTQNPRLLDGIDDRKFEELIATLLWDLGLQDVELTPPRGDGGRDVIVTHVGIGGRRSRYLIECKHWVSGNKVTMHWAIKLASVARRDQADAAILLSSSGFGPKLLEQEASFMKDKVFLKDAGNVARWISLWERQYGAVLVHAVDPRELLELAP
jgi:hypothetical protein